MQRAVDPQYLDYQYGTAERLQVRYETHARYSERTDDFVEWVLDRAAPQPGERVLDVGCGSGGYHPSLARRGVAVIAAVDASLGMVEATQRQALEQQLPVVVMQASAEELQRVPSGAYDLVMANHMLFHVADQPAVLREMRRVLAPNGRLLAATSGNLNAARLRVFHHEIARELGYTASLMTYERFNLDDHLGLMEDAFPRVERHIRDDAFIFPDVEPALRFYASGPVDAIENAPSDGSHREAFIRRMRQRVAAVIAAEGVFRDPKSAGCFVCYV